jgi:hypothetical protein
MSNQHHMPEWKTGAEFKASPVQPYLRDVIPVYSKNDDILAHVNCEHGKGEDNARLIRAAPEMYDLLKSLYHEIDFLVNHHKLFPHDGLLEAARNTRALFAKIDVPHETVTAV